jgi:hypothetical protein
LIGAVYPVSHDCYYGFEYLINNNPIILKPFTVVYNAIYYMPSLYANFANISDCITQDITDIKCIGGKLGDMIKFLFKEDQA